jgi:outer membrane protein TolC
MNAPGLDVDSNTLLTPSTNPDPIEFSLDEPALMHAALAQRSELIELELLLAADAVQQGLDRDALLPLVNLTYTYRLNGAGSTLGSSLDVLTEADFPDWTLALSAEMPLGNEAAKSRLRQTILRRIARLSTKAERERAIRQEVLNAVDALRAGWQRILAARQSVVLNTRALRAEQRQFDVGNSTSTNVLDAATRLAESQLAEIRAITDYQTAQADLAFATGTVMGMAKVSFEPAPSPSIDQPDPPEWPRD